MIRENAVVRCLVATALLMTGLLSTAVPAASAAALTTAVPVTAEAAAPSYYDIYCDDIDARDGYQPCNNSQSIAANQFVRISVTSAGGRTVRFRAYNVDGNHKLGETGNMAAGSDRELVWRNDTGRPILVEMKVDLQGLRGSVNVNARVHVTTF